MPAKKPKAWGWKVVKYYHAKGIKKPKDIAVYMRTKGMLVGRTWVQERLKKYREDVVSHTDHGIGATARTNVGAPHGQKVTCTRSSLALLDPLLAT